MTDKQIIIDGVDVSGCAYFGSTMSTTKNCTMDSEYLHSCESCYCYYKQLKKAMNQIVDLNKSIQAKEQECESLSKGYAELTDIVAPYMDDFTGYNEELGGFDLILCVKELLDQLKAENDELKKYIKHLHNLCGNETDRQYQYKQTLTEIKEIIHFNKTNRLLGGAYISIEQILQKISEVEDGI